MPHPLVRQLRFTRAEFQRALAGLSEEDAQRRMAPMNCISWNVGHLAWQEQEYFLWGVDGRILLPHIRERFAVGSPGSAPSLREVQAAWQTITAAADPWLLSLTTQDLAREQWVTLDESDIGFTFGSLMQRVIYHYWYHTGENMAIRQMLGHTNLPQFVGDIESEAPYLPEG